MPSGFHRAADWEEFADDGGEEKSSPPIVEPGGWTASYQLAPMSARNSSVCAEATSYLMLPQVSMLFPKYGLLIFLEVWTQSPSPSFTIGQFAT